MNEALAGPSLRQADSDQVILWIATRGRVPTEQIRAEVFDPLPKGMDGFIDEPRPQPLGTLTSVARMDLSLSLRLMLLTIRPAKSTRFPVLRALAYRVSLDGGTSWLEPSGGAHELPGMPKGQQLAASNVPAKTSFPLAWFAVTPFSARWAILCIPSHDSKLIADADTYIARVEGSTQPWPGPVKANPVGDYVPHQRPSRAIFFSADRISAPDPLLNNFLRTISSDPRELAEGSVVWHGARFLLAQSPELVRMHRTESNEDVAAEDAARGRARIASRVPTCMLESDAAMTPSARAAFFACCEWGTEPVPVPAEAINKGIASLPEQVALTSPDVAVFRRSVQIGRYEGPRELALAIGPAILEPSGKGATARDDEFKNLDATLVISPSQELSYFLGAKGTSASPKGTRDSTTSAGRPRGSAFQVALRVSEGPAEEVAVEMPKDPPPLALGDSIAWAKGAYRIDPKAPKVYLHTTERCFVTVTRTGRELRTMLMRNADQGMVQSFSLRASGRVVPMSEGNAGSLYIGNRFANEAAKLSHDYVHFADVEVSLGGAAPMTSTANGEIIGLAAGAVDGEHVLEVRAGPLVITTSPGPDFPTSAQIQAGVQRIWRQRSFRVLVIAGKIVEIDGETVDQKRAVRVLLDPTWMKLARKLKAQPNPDVKLVVLHRPEVEDAATLASSWTNPKNKKPVAHFVLARDGTLIKFADEAANLPHAGDDKNPWRARWRGEHPNTIGLGIEIAKAHDELGPYTDEQYDTLKVYLQEVIDSPRQDLNVMSTEIVGHYDVNVGHHDDPGLTFEWSRLEEAGLSLRRADPPAPLTGPLPIYPPTYAKPGKGPEDRKPTSEWARAAAADRKLFATMYAGKTSAQRETKLTELLKYIGYNENVGFKEMIQGFRSHFFSGARRTRFGYTGRGGDEWNLEEESEGDSKDYGYELTAVWIRQVADRVAVLRGDPLIPP